MLRRIPLQLAWFACLCASAARGNTLLDPTAPVTMGLFNLGTVPDVASSYATPVYYQGIAVNGNSLLLSVGDPSTATQKVWSLPLVRANDHIVGFGSPSVYVPAQAYPGNCCVGNMMSGGLVPVGSGLLYTTQSISFLGQHTGGNPGSSTMLDLTSTGVSSGGLNYVPGSFTSNGAGQLKMSSICEVGSFGCNAQGDWYTLNLNGSIGSYTLGSYAAYVTGVTALSFDFVPADLTFTAPGVVLGDPSQLRLDYYQVDGNGNPCNPNVNLTCGPIVHLVMSDVQIGLGVVRDPVTGDILFTTADNQVFVLTDSLPEPSSVVLVLSGIAAATAWKRRRANSPRS